MRKQTKVSSVGLQVVDKWIAKGHSLRLHIVTQDLIANAICYGSSVDTMCTLMANLFGGRCMQPSTYPKFYRVKLRLTFPALLCELTMTAECRLDVLLGPRARQYMHEDVGTQSLTNETRLV